MLPGLARRAAPVRLKKDATMQQGWQQATMELMSV